MVRKAIGADKVSKDYPRQKSSMQHIDPTCVFLSQIFAPWSSLGGNFACNVGPNPQCCVFLLCEFMCPFIASIEAKKTDEENNITEKKSFFPEHGNQAPITPINIRKILSTCWLNYSNAYLQNCLFESCVHCKVNYSFHCSCFECHSF